MSKMGKRVGRRLLACVIVGLLVMGTAPARVGPADQDLAAGQGAPRTSQSFRLATGEAATLAGGLPVRLNRNSLRDGELRW